MDKYQNRTIITVLGVGGGGNNAVNHMYLQDIEGVSFVVSDTDRHQLEESPVPDRVLLGPNTTQGQSAINDHEVARRAAEESEPEISALFDDDTKMVIITAGMGGGTGTGAAPVVARIAREKGVLTIGFVTIPFLFEGSLRNLKALTGIEEMTKYVDALFIINNEHLTEIYSDINGSNAYLKADETLTTAVSSLCGLITIKSKLSMDFNDVNSSLRKSGNAFIVSGFGSGEHRVTKALQNAMESPLLKDCEIFSSKKMLMEFFYNPDSESPLFMEEMREVQEFMEIFDHEVDVIWTLAYDSTLKDQIKVSVLASGFNVSIHGPHPVDKEQNIE